MRDIRRLEQTWLPDKVKNKITHNVRLYGLIDHQVSIALYIGVTLIRYDGLYLYNGFFIRENKYRVYADGYYIGDIKYTIIDPGYSRSEHLRLFNNCKRTFKRVTGKKFTGWGLTK